MGSLQNLSALIDEALLFVPCVTIVGVEEGSWPLEDLLEVLPVRGRFISFRLEFEMRERARGTGACTISVLEGSPWRLMVFFGVGRVERSCGGDVGGEPELDA